MMESGMFDRHGRPSTIPLKGVRILGDICGLYGELSIEQFYINDEEKELEVIYTFPMPDSAAITHFSARVGDKTITGEIREKGEAFKMYDGALSKGDSAFLLEQFRPNIFQVSLGRILPGEKVIVKIVYLETLTSQDGEVRISIPTLVTPRYIPGSPLKEKLGVGWSNPTGRVPDADFITPPSGSDADYRVELDLNIKPMISIDEFTSPSHRLNTITEADGNVRISLAEGKALLDRDIIILGRCRDESAMAGLAWEDKEKGEGYFYLNLLPDLGPQHDREPLSYIFLIDISGSMGGVKLEQAKNALQLCLRNMELGDRFNIVAFESNCHYYSPRGNVPFSQASLDHASAWINELHAMGGTEILEPVDFALKHSGKDGTVILLFTDGEVGNEQEIFNRVRRGIRDNRLFTFGIDTSVNSYFINRLAESGKGLPEFVYPGERIEDKVIRQFYRINSPLVSNVSVTLGKKQNIEWYPRDLPAIFDRDPVTLVGRYSGTLTGTMTLTGRLNEEDFSMQMDMTRLPIEKEYSFLKKLWAKMKLDCLEKFLYGINPRRGKVLLKEIAELSLEYGIGSSQTSYVAVHRRMDKTGGIPETVVVPVSPAAEWEMLAPTCMELLSGPDILSSPPAMDMSSCFEDSRGKMHAPLPKHRTFRPRLSRKLSTIAHSALRSPDPDINIEDAVRFVAMQQKADGSFPAENGAADLEASIFENTALATLAMLLAPDNSRLYRRQIEKSIEYLAENRLLHCLDEFQCFAAGLACRFYLERIKPAKSVAGEVEAAIEAMSHKADSLSGRFSEPEPLGKNVLDELLIHLDGGKNALADITAISGIRKLVTAIFEEMLHPAL
jgi:Ca-activated chloride channel family protein